MNSKDKETINNICQEILGDKIKEDFARNQQELDYTDGNPVRSVFTSFSSEYDVIRTRVLDSVPELKNTKQSLIDLSISTDVLFDKVDQLIDQGVKKVAQDLANTSDYNVYEVVFGGKTLYYEIASKHDKTIKSANDRVKYLRLKGLDAEYDGYKVVVTKLIGHDDPCLEIDMVENEDGSFSLLVVRPDPPEEGGVVYHGGIEGLFLDKNTEIEFLTTALPIMQRFVGDKHE